MKNNAALHLRIEEKAVAAALTRDPSWDAPRLMSAIASLVFFFFPYMCRSSFDPFRKRRGFVVHGKIN